MVQQSFLKMVSDWYQNRFPVSTGQRTIGMEKEYPVIDSKSHEAADIRRIFPLLIEQGWQPCFDDVNQEVILGVEKDKVLITTDAGWCTLEIAMPPTKTIGQAKAQLEAIEKIVTELARYFDMQVLGYGIQPKTAYSSELWISKRRHQLIRQALPVEVNAVTITAADQVHLDIGQTEIVDCLNIFNAISGLLVHLFANSPIWLGNLDQQKRMAVREAAWEFLDRSRIGMPLEPFESLEQFISKMVRLELLVAKQNGDYSLPRQSYADFVSQNQETDWQYHWYLLEGMTWLNARPRTPYATIEIRPACCQKIEGTAALAALNLGLLENLVEVKELVNQFTWPVWVALKNHAIFGLASPKLTQLSTELVALAEKGLKQRGLAEQIFLDPLKERLENQTNPAKQAMSLLEHKGWQAFIDSLVI